MDMTYRGQPLFSDEPITLTVAFSKEDWAAAQERGRREDARIEAEMAACPHVSCTCGWHSED